MSATKRAKIGLREVRALQPGQTVWDTAVPGFCARRRESAAIFYGFKYRTKSGRQRWFTIGRHGAPWTPDSARAEVLRLLGAIVEGSDPSGEKIKTRHAVTVSQLCDLYVADVKAGRVLTRRQVSKKASTLATDEGRIERHIKPLLGRLAVAAVTRSDVETFMFDVAEGKTAGKTKTAKARGLANVRGGKGTASRTVGLLGAIFSYALRQRLRDDNPVRGIIRFADGKRDRRLDEAEYGLLSQALAEADDAGIWPSAVAAAHLLALTGWRSGEVLNLRWTDVDFQRRTATLADTKTGRSVRPLSQIACGLIRQTPHLGDLVFPATRGDGRMAGFPRLWKKITALGKLPTEVTPHTLRHSYASVAADLGYSEPTIAALIGHKGQSITSRYIHSADAVLLAAADKIAEEIDRLLNPSCALSGAAEVPALDNHLQDTVVVLRRQA